MHTVSDAPILVRRSSGEALRPECLQRTSKPPPSVMTWGCFTSKSVGRTAIVKNTMDSKQYREFCRTSYYQQPKISLLHPSRLSSKILHLATSQNWWRISSNNKKLTSWSGLATHQTSIPLRMSGFWWPSTSEIGNHRPNLILWWLWFRRGIKWHPACAAV